MVQHLRTVQTGQNNSLPESIPPELISWDHVKYVEGILKIFESTNQICLMQPRVAVDAFDWVATDATASDTVPATFEATWFTGSSCALLTQHPMRLRRSESYTGKDLSSWKKKLQSAGSCSFDSQTSRGHMDSTWYCEHNLGSWPTIDPGGDFKSKLKFTSYNHNKHTYTHVYIYIIYI